MKKRIPTQDIGTELDTFIRTHVLYETPDKEWFKKTKSEISKIAKSHFPTKTHQTFVEMYVVDNEFHCLIGFRKLEDKKFSFINCGCGMEGAKDE